MPPVRVRPSGYHLPIPPYALKPTCVGICIESEEDALKLIEGCLLHPRSFPLLRFRLGPGEQNRHLVAHGNVFVFEQQPGLQRWTDCCRWMGNSEEDRFWLVSAEAELLQKAGDTYGKGLNIDHRKPNSKRYLRTDLRLKLDGLIKRTVTIDMLSHPHYPNDIRTFEIVSYVDPIRRDELRPAQADPILSKLAIPANTYFDGNDPLPRSNPLPKRTRRTRRLDIKKRARLPEWDSMTPSLSPTTTLAAAFLL